MPRDQRTGPSPGQSLTTWRCKAAPKGNDDKDDSAFTAVLERFVRPGPLKDELTDFETTFCASFLKQADGLASSRAILEAFLGPVRGLLGRNLLDSLLPSPIRSFPA